MFGQRDNSQKQDNTQQSHDDIAAAAEAIASDRQIGGFDASSDAPVGGTLGSFMSSSTPSQPEPALVTPAQNGLLSPTTAPDPISSGDNPEPPVAATDTAAAAPNARGKADGGGEEPNELLNIKQDALQALTPLVSQLNQTPEEQFRTTMMMIQASDNYSLIKVAYEAAQKISNEKERAQALLDIVNEINYFTQQA